MERRRIKRVSHRYAVTYDNGFLMDGTDDVDTFGLKSTAEAMAHACINRGLDATVVPVRVTVEAVEG